MEENALTDDVLPSSKLKPVKNYILFAALTLGLVLASHLIPSFASGIGQIVQSTTGLLTTTEQARTASLSAEVQLERVREDLQAAQVTIEGREAEIIRLQNAMVLTEASLLDQKSLNNAVRADLAVANIMVTAVQSEFEIVQRDNMAALIALQTAVEDERTANQQMLRLRGKMISSLASSRGRIKRMTASNLGATLGESIPFFGIGVIVAGTTYEMTESCAAMDEMTDLLKLLDPAEYSSEDGSHAQICGLNVPTKEELWQDVKSSPSAAWETSKRAVSDVSDWAGEIEGPDMSRIEAWFRHVF